MNNSVYGKTMENLRKIIKVGLVNNTKDYKKWVSRPSFVSQKIFNKNLVKINVWILSQKHFKKCDAKLSFTDTDSLIYKIKTEDFMKLFFKIKVYLILVTIQKIQSFPILSIRKKLVKWKINLKEK